MGPYLNFVGPALEVLKRLAGAGTDLLGTIAGKASANPKASLAAAAVGGFYIKPEYVVMAGAYIGKFGRFVASVGAAMGG